MYPKGGKTNTYPIQGGRKPSQIVLILGVLILAGLGIAALLIFSQAGKNLLPFVSGAYETGLTKINIYI